MFETEWQCITELSTWRWFVDRFRTNTECAVVDNTVVFICHLWTIKLRRYQFCARYYLEDSIFILKIKDSIFILYLQDAFGKYTYWRYFSQDTFCTLCKIHHSNYITTTTGMHTSHDYMEGQWYCSTSHPIAVSQQIHARLIWHGRLKTEF